MGRTRERWNGRMKREEEEEEEKEEPKERRTGDERSEVEGYYL